MFLSLFKKFEGYFQGRSYSWTKIRKEHLRKYPECAACGRKDTLEVHHIVPYHVDPKKELDPNNLITLCGKHCHFVFGHLMDWKSWNKDVCRDVVKYRHQHESRPRKN
jgi:5-methylcytosine-specific restriction enzyme A